MKDITFTNIFTLANVDAQKVLASLEDDPAHDGDTESQSRKRKRLDDLTPQERMIRRYYLLWSSDSLSKFFI